MLKKIDYIFDKIQKIKLVILFIIMFIGGVLELLGVSLILPLVNVVMEPDAVLDNSYAMLICDILGLKSSKEFILFLLLVLIGVYIIKNVFLVFMYNTQYRFTFNNERRLSLRMMTCYMEQDYIFHLSKNTAELQRNVTSDVNQFFSMVLDVIQLLSELITCVFLIVYLMMMDIMTTLSVAGIISVFVLIFYLWFKRTMVKQGEQYREGQAVLTKWINQSFGGLKEIKVMSREHFFLKNFDESYKRVTVVQRKRNLMTIVPKPVLESISICGILFVMVVRVLMGDDLAKFVPVLSVFAVAAFRLLPAFNRITAYLGQILFSKASVDAVYEDLKEVELLNQERKQREHTYRELHLNQFVDIKDVSFRYPNVEQYVLNHVDLRIPANQSVALIGPSGAGKTTLADVILGLLQPETGQVMIDDLDVFENLYSWHAILGYIPQVIYLIDDTIRNNVTFGISDKEVSDEKVWHALREAQLDTFVKGLEHGLDTEVGERGVRLSGGQRQRIGIARALYNNPQILVMDEATSALDNETETAVMESIESLQGSKTMIIIAHRLTTIRNCDLIYEVNHGKVMLRDRKDVIK